MGRKASIGIAVKPYAVLNAEFVCEVVVFSLQSALVGIMAGGRGYFTHFTAVGYNFLAMLFSKVRYAHFNTVFSQKFSGNVL